MSTLAPAAVFVPPRSVFSDLRAVRIVWHRDLLRFWQDKPRIFASLLQPLLYLFVFGSGMAKMVGEAKGFDLRVFLFPGVLSMSVLFTCFFSAGSLVWDREFGFMREMLVAPVRRGAILVGKCLGGATTGAFQGVVVIAVGGLVGVPYSPLLLLKLAGILLVLSFAVTALGLVVAVRLKNMQGFMALVQMLLMPMFFLSGALFPVNGLPKWLELATRLDPLTYAVDPMRRLVLSAVGAPQALAGVTWGTWPVPMGLELALVFGCGLVALLVATAVFSRPE